ncbi:MAG: hypothetical protein RLZZ244_2558 [Verrucomicrobiota bacterium]|jgi:N-acetylglucosamine-6-phosphate deacetylase
MIPSPAPPGLFDLQVNGFAGVDFQTPPSLAALRCACEKLHACGTTRILVTFITDSFAALRAKLRAFETLRSEDPLLASTLAGYHLEGPFLSAEPGFCGAHPPALMRDPDWHAFSALQEAAGGAIRLVTLAPERPGSADFIQRATHSGVRISLGHTDASASQIDEAIQAGATLCTHLGNGCPALLHRHENIIQRLLCRDELMACLIPDGIHLPPPVLRSLFRAKPPGKVLLTTDAMAAAGAPPGRYTLGPLSMEVGADLVVRMPNAPQFAGSALRLDWGVHHAAAWLGIPLEEARAMASTLPAQALGLPL